LFGPGNNSGTFNASAGTTIDPTDVCYCYTIFEPASVITGAGTFQDDSELTIISGTLAVPVLNVNYRLQIDSAGANTATTFTTLNLNGTLSGSRTISVTNLLNWQGGSMDGSGHTAVLGGAQLNFGASRISLNAPRVLDNYG